MLSVGLTGGIGSGKSAVSSRLARRGAAVVDADALAREVVAPGTPGLGALVAEFGVDVLLPDGSLDRAGLGCRVFADAEARSVLNGIVHPLVRARTVELAGEAERSGAAVLVQDVPLLVENGLAPAHHLVVVVEAPLPERLRRLTELRGFPEQDAHARVTAQATDDRRRELADVLLANDRGLPELDERVEQLWSGRLQPYAGNLDAGRRAPRVGVRLVPSDPSWAAAGRRLVDRLRWLCGPHALAVEHIGSTAVPGLPARDVIDLQVEVADLEVASELADTLTEGGFPGLGRVDDAPRPELDPDPVAYRKALHLNADPGRAADVHVRAAGSTSARAAVALRDLLRRDPSAREAYGLAKTRLAAQHPDDVEAYADARTPVLVQLLVRAVQAR